MDYTSAEWIKRRSEIIRRDGSRCQNCKTFDPSGEHNEIVTQNGDFQFHGYKSNPLGSTYTIYSQKYDLDIDICFDKCWLITPIMQVHHLLYITGRESWDYDDSFLITLCKSCHTMIHKDFDIPIYDRSMKLISKTRMVPNDTGSGLKSKFAPWVFIKRNRYEMEYEVTEINPKVQIIIFEDSMKSKIDIQKNAVVMTQDFISEFLPKYQPKK